MSNTEKYKSYFSLTENNIKIELKLFLKKITENLP